MRDIKLYTRSLCSWCIEAKNYLRAHDIPYDEIDVGREPEAYEEMRRLSGQNYVPTLVVDGHVLADFDTQQLEEFLDKNR